MCYVGGESQSRCNSLINLRSDTGQPVVMQNFFQNGKSCGHNSAERKVKMKQVIIRDGKVLCTTTVPYSDKIVKQMKKAGYKVKEIEK